MLAQFDRIAQRYDLANDLISLGMHRLWKHAALRSLNIKPDGRYLDVCTGTGDLALTLAKWPGFAGQIVGLDFSSGMLQVASERLARERQSAKISCNLEWIQGDALNLRLPDNSFDGAIISFGLRNLSDYLGGLSEMARVVKPGGYVVNLDLGRPSLPVFTPLFYFFFDNIVPLIGEIVQQDRQAYTYLPESRKLYPEPARLTGLFQEAGLTGVRHVSLACGSVALHVGQVR